jgi:hypothetical protein
MCGMCGAGSADPLGVRVAGPTKRHYVARFLNERITGRTVTPFVSGWTVSTQTGATEVFQAITGLLDHVSAYAVSDPDDLRLRLFEELDRLPAE